MKYLVVFFACFLGAVVGGILPYLPDLVDELSYDLRDSHQRRLSK